MVVPKENPLQGYHWRKSINSNLKESVTRATLHCHYEFVLKLFFLDEIASSLFENRSKAQCRYTRRQLLGLAQSTSAKIETTRELSADERVYDLSND